MKKIIVFLLFGIMATGYMHAQTVVRLLLPDNCTENTSSIENPKLETNLSLDIFPNPNDGRFSLSANFKEIIGKADIRIFNSLGIVVFTESIYCNSQKYIKQLYLNNLAAGIYILTFKSDAKVISTKLLIK